MKHKERIYLDYAAATPLDPRVLKKMMPYFGERFGNPSSLHQEGRLAKQAIETARRVVASILSVTPDELIFAGSGTESAALALCGIAKVYPGGHIITTSLEHAAVLENVHALQSAQHRITMVDAELNGVVDPKKLSTALRKDTVLISVMYVSNEIGSVQPLSDIARVIRRERNRRKEVGEKLPLYFHTDACQAAEYLPLSIPRLGVDLMTLNASKIYGPKGIGLLYKRRGIAMKPFWEGGGQEQGLRSGTENVAGIVGFMEALKISEKRKQKEYARMAQLQQYFIKELTRLAPRAMLQGPSVGALRVPNNVNIRVPGISAETLILYLDERGVAASAGSACASHQSQSPHVVRTYEEGVRFTMGRHTTRADVDYAAHALCDSIEILR
ncbi:MAG: cysteine desulfurase [Parcubacteria group bacterium Gr01-1014_70]|nr:MAG: cysteine desulfurase [Parcubacteria group bacterium Gr01-1014_70]